MRCDAMRCDAIRNREELYIRANLQAHRLSRARPKIAPGAAQRGEIKASAPFVPFVPSVPSVPCQLCVETMLTINAHN